MRGIMLLALLALMIAPAASAGPVADPSVCYDDCVTQEASVGEGGIDAAVGVHVANGVGVGTHAGPDGAYVTLGVGITRCTVGTGPSGCVY